MANEPKNAEEQLKQYAAERRQNAPQEMHAATRNLLQGEVRRTYGNPAEDRRVRTRLRWMQAFAALAIAAAIPLFLLPRNPRENVQEALPTQNNVTLPTQEKQGAPLVLSDAKEPVAPLATATPEAAAVLKPSAPVTTRDEARNELRSRALELQAKRIAPEKKEIAGDAAAGSNVSNFSLANVVSNQPILNRFQFEQTGPRVKIIEADGSVYPGRVISQQNGNDVFYAAGVSRSLNQAVTVTGQVVRASLVAAQQTRPQGAARQDSPSNLLQNTASNFSVYNNSEEVRVQGQATVGGSQYKVDAQVTPGP